MWAGSWPNSSKRHENCCYWVARNVIGIIHAALVAGITVPALLSLRDAPDVIRFGHTPHLATCRMSEGDVARGLGIWNTICQAVAFAGLAFTAFTSADVLITMRHNLATLDF